MSVQQSQATLPNGWAGGSSEQQLQPVSVTAAGFTGGQQPQGAVLSNSVLGSLSGAQQALWQAG